MEVIGKNLITVIAGIRKNRTRLRRVSQVFRPVYSRAKISHATGTMTMPRYPKASASIPMDRSADETSMAVLHAQMETAIMRSANGCAETYERFLQPVTARIAVIQPQAIKGIQYGEYCQIIAYQPQTCASCRNRPWDFSYRVL
jgi:hypothetical protein